MSRARIIVGAGVIRICELRSRLSHFPRLSRNRDNVNSMASIPFGDHNSIGCHNRQRPSSCALRHKVRTFAARGVSFICQRFAMTAFEIRLLVRRRSRMTFQFGIGNGLNARIASIRIRGESSSLDPRSRS